MKTKPLSWSVMQGLSFQAQPVGRYVPLKGRTKKAVYMKIRILFDNKNKTMAVTRATYDEVYAAALLLLSKVQDRESIPEAWIIRQPTWDDVLTKLDIVETITYRYDRK